MSGAQLQDYKIIHPDANVQVYISSMNDIKGKTTRPLAPKPNVMSDTAWTNAHQQSILRALTSLKNGCKNNEKLKCL